MLYTVTGGLFCFALNCFPPIGVSDEKRWTHLSAGKGGATLEVGETKWSLFLVLCLQLRKRRRVGWGRNGRRDSPACKTAAVEVAISGKWPRPRLGPSPPHPTYSLHPCSLVYWPLLRKQTRFRPELTSYSRRCQLKPYLATTERNTDSVWESYAEVRTPIRISQDLPAAPAASHLDISQPGFLTLFL